MAGALVIAASAIYCLGGAIYLIRSMHYDDGRERFDIWWLFFWPVLLCIVIE